MNRDGNLDLLKKMNVKSDVILINQTSINSYNSYDFQSYTIKERSSTERGLSNSRNMGLSMVSGDIVCLSDDDVIYTDSYRQDIIAEFDKHPNADAIFFNLKTIPENSDRESNWIKSYKRVGRIDARNYGSVHLAFRVNKWKKNKVYFDPRFGAGAFYNCGEDTIFVKKLMDNNFKIYKSPICIGIVDMSTSSWFNGYNRKYFYNKGALIGALYPMLGTALIFILTVKNSVSKLGSISNFFTLYEWYNEGYRDFLKHNDFKCLNK